MAGQHEIRISPLLSLAFQLYDRYKENQNAEAAKSILSDVASATGPEDVSFIQQNVDKYGLKDPYTIMAINKHLNDVSNAYAVGQQQADLNKVVGNYTSDYANYAETMNQEGRVASPGDFAQQFAQRYGGIGPEVLKAAGNAVTQGVSEAENIADKKFTNMRQEAQDKNQIDFLSAVAGLMNRSESPSEIRKNAIRGGYASGPEMLSDVLAAAAAYPPGKDMLASELANVRAMGKETYPPESRKIEKVGKTTATVDYNLFGEPKRVEQYTQPTFNIKVGTSPEEKATKEFRTELKILQGLEKQYNSFATKPAILTQEKADKAAVLQRVQSSIELQRARMEEMFPDKMKVYSPVPKAKKVVRTGTDKQGRRVVQYDDGSIEYAK